MIAQKASKSASKKSRFIIGWHMSEDGIVKALKKMCKEAGMKFEPSQKPGKRK
jgi:hypothetical protein